MSKMSTSVVDEKDFLIPSSATVQNDKKCGICMKDVASYTCPRCNRPYCSVKCYQDEAHADCSESFYRGCVLEELASRSETGDPESRRRVQEALMKLYQQSNDEQDIIEELDSDDESEEDDLADRLKGIDLNDADAIWANLSAAERTEFRKMIQSEDIHSILPDWKPWWLSKPVEELEEHAEPRVIPDIFHNVPKFPELSKNKPASCFPFNVANAIAGYVYCTRQFLGDQQLEPLEAINVTCNIAGSLQRKENFTSFSHAIAAASAEAISRDESTGEIMDLLKKDVECIMKNPLFLQAALSDLLILLHAALKSSKKPKSQAAGTFTRQFCSTNSGVNISASEIKSIIKKIEFYLSWSKEFS